MLPSPIPFAPASPSSTGKNLTVEVPVPLIPSNRPVPLMISLVNLADVGHPGAVLVNVLCVLRIIVEPSEKVMVWYWRESPDPLIASLVVTEI